MLQTRRYLFTLKQLNRCERLRKTSFVMKAGSLSIFVCAFFVFSAEGVPSFTSEPQKPSLAVEGENITLEWKYTFSKEESFRQASFDKDDTLVDKHATDSTPWIEDAYKGRLYVNITNHYTSITLLRVKRTDKGSYKLEIVTNPRRRRTSSKLEISVSYLDQPNITSPNTRLVEGSDVTLSCNVGGEPMPTITWTVNGFPLNTIGNSRISFMEDNKNLIIANVNRTDGGEYQCVAHSILGNVSSNATILSIQYPPAVGLNPSNATKEEGENITWSCKATGNPEPTISWIFNASHMNTNSNPRIVFSKGRQKMTIISLSRTDSGEYQCIAFNNLGNTSSEVASLDVTYIPEITAHPHNVTKKEGDNATLNCNALGNPRPKISWNKGGLPLGNSSSISLSADNKDLTIQNVDRGDSGEYRCVATNSLGNDTSNPAYLGVQYKPEIQAVPRLIQRTEGDELSLFCNATGNPIPTMSWTKNGFPLDTSNDSRINFSNKGKQLTIENVNKRDGGVYLCVADNILGNATSHDATLEVHYIPEVTIIGGPQQFAVVGKTKKLVCKYNAMPPVSEAKWIKDGNVISRNSSLLIRNVSHLTVLYHNESQLQLHINESTSQDAGNYTCLVINAVGNSSQMTSVISQELPSVSIHPRRETVLEGKRINLSCNATGNPEPSISWVKDGFSINNNSRISFSQDNERLTITNVSRTDSGKYRCVAKNRVGNDTANSKVDVLFEPEVSIDGNQKQYVAKGGDVWLICRYGASPPVSEVQWIKDGTLIAKNASKLINGSRVTIPSFNESQIQLSITTASLKDGGNYTCNATNILSSTQDTTVIIIEDKPEIATHPHNITIVEGDDVTLYCNATGNPAPTISWTNYGNPISNGSRIILSPSHQQLTITNVNRIDGGEYKCQAKNRVGTDTSYASTVNVQYRAEIVSHPQAIVTREEGSNLTLFCNATGNPAAKISWTKDGSHIDNDTRINFSEDNERLNIRNVNRKDKGSYRCVANNSLGNDTSNVSTVHIQYRPELAAQPQIVTKPEGENVTFTCNATGNPEPELSWFKDEHLVRSSNRISLSAGNKSLMIANVNRADSGKYLCVAHNKVGNATSNTATLNVQYQPEIITDPSDDVVKEGKNTTLYCNATGNPVPTISWEKTGNSIGNNSRISYSAENRELKIVNVNRTDSGTYRCVAVNSINNTTSRDANLVVEYQSEITTHPRNETKREGENVTLHCNATGNPLPTLSWTKDGSDVSNKSRISFSEDKNQLTITNVQRVDSGAYRCVAKNSLGNTTSDAALVNVQYQSRITTHPSNVTKREGENVTLNCNASGNPLPTLSWTKDGSRISNNPRISFSEDKKQLAITGASREDRGGYLCVAHNKIGNDIMEIAILDVHYRPEIATQPQIVTIPEGEDVTFTCNTTGNPEPKLSWLKDEHLVRSSDRVSLSAGNRFLMIGNVNRTDSGKYLCVAHNEVGNTTMNITILKVQFAPEISKHPRNIAIVKGENVSFRCSVVGNPTPSVVWTKNGKELDVSANSRLKLTSENNNHSLEIAEVHLSDSGQYICVANNSVDRSSSSAATLKVQVVPDPPRNITVDSQGSRVLRISWMVGFNGNSAIENYTVEISKDNQIFKDVECHESLSSSACVVSSPSRTASLTGLFPWTVYSIRVFATNKIGRSDSSHILNVSTDEEVPSEAPSFVVTVLSSTAVNVSWQVLRKQKARGAIFGYHVLYRVKRTLPWMNKTVDRAATTSLLVGPLNKHTKYEFAMQAFNGKGVSNLSALVEKTTQQQKPSGPPQKVTLKGLTSTSISIKWDPVPAADRNGIIQGYKLSYQALPNGDIDTKLFNISIKQQNERVTKILNNLNEFTNYSIGLLAFTLYGDGPPSAAQLVQTLQDKPSAPPANVRGRNTSSTSILVEWGKVPSADRNGIITTYNITYHSLTENHRDSTTVDFPERQVTLMGLKEFVNYSITVFASTAVGKGPASDPIFVSSNQDRPSCGPENVSSTDVNYTTNKITWATLHKEVANGLIKLYEVHFELKESCLKVGSTFRAMNTTKSSLLLTGFWMCAEYEVSVRGYTVAGPGPYSKAIVVQTKSLKLSKMWSKEAPSSPSFSQTSKGQGLTANITLPRFPGNAKFFQVIVIRYSLDFTGVVSSPDSFTPKVLMTYEEAHKSSFPAAYVTFQFRGYEFNAFRQFVVGDGAHSNSKTRKRRRSNGEDFLNKPLQPNTKYRVFLRAFVDKAVYISSNFVTIETKGKPNVKGLPERTIFQVGDVVVLTCEATGDPKPSVSWSKDGNTNITRAQFRNDDHILVIQEVAPRDGGIYECRASNIFGERRIATAVIIAVPPSIRKDVSPPSVLCVKGTPCSLLCHATSDIPFNYSWTRNSHALNGRNIKVLNNTLVVTPLDDQDFGDYVCHAANLFGSTTYKITLYESLEEEHNVQGIFRAGDIVWSCIVFVLLVLIGVLIRRLRRAQANNRTSTAEKTIIVDGVQSASPLEQHVSQPDSYMELQPRPLDGQTRRPSEYQSLQGGHANPGYYNVVPEEGKTKGPSEEIYEEIELYDC